MKVWIITNRMGRNLGVYATEEIALESARALRVEWRNDYFHVCSWTVIEEREADSPSLSSGLFARPLTDPRD